MESSHSHRIIVIQHTPLWMLQEVDLVKLWEAAQPESTTYGVSQCSICQKHLSGPHPECSSSTTSTSKSASRCARCQSWNNKQDQLQVPHQTISQSLSTCDQSGEDPACIQPSITSPKALLEMIKWVGVTENEKEMLYAGLAIYNAQTGKSVSQSSSSLQDQVKRCHDRIESSLKALDSTAATTQYNEFGNWVWGLLDEYLACNQSLPRALESRP